jgi:LysR family glycine cleavage system transcriptional activator
MRKRLPPLPTLLAFEAVAELGSFSKAGESLALTHSAVSHQIRQLEEHLGLRLLNRLPSGVALTREGEIYLAEVKAALKLLEAAQVNVKQSVLERPLRISVLPSFASSMVVPELLSFLEQNPSIKVEIDARAGLENDENANVDVFIRYGKGEWPHYESLRLADVELFPVCSPDYVKRHGPFEKLEDLSRVVLLRHTMEPWQGWLKAIGADAEARIIPAGPLYTDAKLMLMAACDGQGVALARNVLAEPDLRAGRLVRLFEYRVPSSQGYYAYFRPGATSQPSIRLFLDWLMEVCKRLNVR